jgi:transposase
MKKKRAVPYKNRMEAMRARKIGMGSGMRERIMELLINTDMTQTEIAEELGISQGTVASHVSREYRQGLKLEMYTQSTSKPEVLSGESFKKAAEEERERRMKEHWEKNKLK